MKSQFFRRSQPCNSASSHEVLQHINHIIILLSSILVSRGPCGSFPCGSCPCLKIGLISRPRNYDPELLEGRPRERTGILALLVQGVSVEALIQLHLTPVISRLLASHMLHICVHMELYPPLVSRDGIQRWRLP